MPLSKKLSKVFKSHGSTNHHIPRSAFSDIAEEVEAPTVRASTAVDDSSQVLVATQASYETEIGRLESHARLQTERLEQQQQNYSQAYREIGALRLRIKESDRRFSDADDTHRAQLTAVNTRLRITADLLATEVQKSATARKEILDARTDLAGERKKNAELEQEMVALKNDFRAMYTRCLQYDALMKDSANRLAADRKTIAQLQLKLTLALQLTNDESNHAYEEASSWIDDKEKRAEEFRKEMMAKDQQVDNLKSDLSKSSTLCTSFKTRVHDLEADLQRSNDQLKAKDKEFRDTKIALEALRDGQAGAEEKMAKMEQQLIQIRSLFGPNPTPRQVLLVMRSRCELPSDSPRQDSRDSTKLGSLCIDNLKVEDLDRPLNALSFHTFVQSVAVGSSNHGIIEQLFFAPCSRCKRSKLENRGGPADMELLEFSNTFRYTYCANSDICKDCLMGSLRVSITESWWGNLGNEQWLTCPVRGCRHVLDIHSADDLDNMLTEFSQVDVSRLKAMYRVAGALRTALAEADLRLSPEEITASIVVYRRLLAYDTIQDIFNFFNTPRNSSRDNEDVDVGEIAVATLDESGLRIPLFLNLFRRKETPRDCTICLESFHEIVGGNEEQLQRLCTGYNGSWISNLYPFPTKEILKCDHDINFCKGCIGQHLNAQLDLHGRNATGKLTCPTCNRVLPDEEIRMLSPRETTDRYDNYLFMSYLAQDPNFRSCLRSGCTNGEIYEQDEFPNPHIACSSCTFEMCFTHQVPWHTGLSCSQYQSQLDHGDPEFQQTTDWIETNSKPCPGTNCGVRIEKGNQCFHMTCWQCRYEFCWLCLADWNAINPRQGTYVKTAHNTGCFFRTSNVQPTQMFGANLEEALQRRRAG